MNEQTPPPAGRTIAQELGADPEFAARKAAGRVWPLSLGRVICHLTQRYPLTMLGLAFVAGTAYAGRIR